MTLQVTTATAVSAYPGATAWKFSAETGDIDFHAECQSGWTLKYEQLSAGPFNGTVRHVQLPGLRLVYEAANRRMRQCGSLGANCYGFAIAHGLEGECLFNGQRLADNSIMVGSSDDLDLCSPRQFSLLGVVVCADLLTALWESIFKQQLSAWLDQQVVVRIRPHAADGLRAFLSGAFDSIAERPTLLEDPVAVQQLRDAVLIEWLDALPAEVDISDLKTVAARKRVVDRACAWMLSQPCEPVSILQVCSHIGASRRKLNYCFQDILGLSPVKYLRAVKLNGVRRELKQTHDPHVGVHDVAARWGFWHLSQFSLDYKRQFSELPSVTLKAARGEFAVDSAAAA